MSLEVGQKAPDGILIFDDKTTKNISNFSGSKLLLYFYPKDDTPGCTIQALDFTEQKEKFLDQNTQIIGINADTVEQHQDFSKKHNLSIQLVSDTDKKILEAYGVWGERNMYGKKYMGIERTSILIDEAGIITHIWRRVRPKNHANTVLDTIREMD